MNIGYQIAVGLFFAGVALVAGSFISGCFAESKLPHKLFKSLVYVSILVLSTSISIAIVTTLIVIAKAIFST